MLAPRLHGIHMGHEFLGSRIEGLVLESFLHECGEPARVLVLASTDFFSCSVSHLISGSVIVGRRGG